MAAQYPHYFSHDDENGLPSNEVFSIIQDSQGFIWLGLDAGLYRFDGVRYHQYKSIDQKSKSMTGLTMSSSGGIYCYNFRSQLFYLNNDSLIEIRHELKRIYGLATDKRGNLYASHSGGISQYSEVKKKWTHYFDFSPEFIGLSSFLTAKCVEASLQDTIHFIYGHGTGQIINGEMQLTHSDFFKNLSPGYFLAEYSKGSMWSFSKEYNFFYSTFNGITQPLKIPELSKVLKGKKITCVRALKDGKLWISTYRGIIAFDPTTLSVQLFYPDLSFSDSMIDREGNYWFTTLQAGMIRVPNMNYTVWNELENNRLIKISNDDLNVYFATLNGTIGKINTLTYELKTYHTSQDADVQSLDYDENRKALYFNINNKLFELKGDKIQESTIITKALKAQLTIGDTYFRASSHGTFINETKIDEYWSRSIQIGENNSVWVATNSGLIKVQSIKGSWLVSKRFLDNHQILAIDYDPESKLLYVIDYHGKVYSVPEEGRPKIVTSISPDLQFYQIVHSDSKIFIATNKGVKIFDLNSNLLSSLDSFSGLISDNVLDLLVIKDALWLATNKGLQRIPISELHDNKPLAQINLRNYKGSLSKIELDYNTPLTLYPEVSCYISNGKFEFAYRINNGKEWFKLPASIENIELLNIPWGDFTIELKAIDHLGRDSDNIITIKGYVNPPFWRTWWFTLLWAILFIGLVSYVAIVIVRNIRKRERERAALVKSQLTALKAQMNPHFMFNTLNSIQALILKQDIKNSNLYLNKFSHLMRIVLDVSGKEEITLQEEIQLLELYLALEKLRFGDDFHYQISTGQEADPYSNMIPPLLLQPFVENAIKHGLLHKKGRKELYIEFEVDGDLRCTITDNGIGRKRAEEIKARQQEKYDSFSLESIEQRLALLNKFSERNFEIEIHDLFEDGRIPIGTKVEVLVPQRHA